MDRIYINGGYTYEISGQDISLDGDPGSVVRFNSVIRTSEGLKAVAVDVRTDQITHIVRETA